MPEAVVAMDEASVVERDRPKTILRAPAPGPTGSSVLRRPTAADVDPVAYRRRRRRLEVSLAILLPVALLGLWQLFAELQWVDPKFFPPPSAIWASAVSLVKAGTLQKDTWISVRRTLLGFGLGAVTGILAGVAVSLSRTVRAALEPLVYGLWTVPKLALLPLLLLIFGIGELPIVLLIAINCFFLSFIPTLAAMLTVPFGYREVGQSFKVSRWQMLRHVSFPAALPQIFVGLRITAGAAILTLVAVEFVESSSGLGFLIWNSWSLFIATQMYVGIVVVAVIGALFTMLVTLVGRKLCPWSREG